MSFFGKEFKFDKQENFDGFTKALGLPEDRAQAALNNHPNLLLTNNGDSYTLYLNSPTFKTKIDFKNGVELDEEVADKVAKSTFEVNGNVVTQTQKFPSGKVITIKREFTDDTLKATVTLNGWDGAAYRYYKA